MLERINPYTRWLVPTNLFRFPMAMAPLAFVLTIGHSRGYQYSGLAMVFFTAGEVAPVFALDSRFFSKFVSDSLVRVALLVTLCWLDLAISFATSMPTAMFYLPIFTLGIFSSVGFSAFRAHLSEVSEQGTLEKKLAFDSSAVELVWLISPIAVSGAVWLWGRSSVLVLVAVLASATWASLILLWPKVSYHEPRHRESFPSHMLFHRNLVWLWICSASEGIAETVMAIGLAPLLAQHGHNPLMAGPALAVVSLTSIAGGITYARVSHLLGFWSNSKRIVVMLSIFGLAVAGASLSSNLIEQLLLLALGGLLIAPTNTSRAIALTEILPRGIRVHGFAVLYGTYSAGAGIAGVAFTVFYHSLSASGLFLLCGLLTLSLSIVASILFSSSLTLNRAQEVL